MDSKYAVYIYQPPVKSDRLLLDVQANLDSMAAVDELIVALQANKPLLPQVGADFVGPLTPYTAHPRP
jgi:hypothetical protein